MYDPITTHEFNSLLHMAVEKHNLDPENTYIEFTWWDKKYRPLDITDCNWKKSEFIMVFCDTLCNTFYKNSGGDVIPTGFLDIRKRGIRRLSDSQANDCKQDYGQRVHAPVRHGQVPVCEFPRKLPCRRKSV